MNFSLHLQTIFTFVRQNKATSMGKIPYTYIRIVLDVCLLCTWTQLLWICFGWKVYRKHSPCTYTYIHISKGREVIRCCKHMLFAFSRGYDLSCNVRSQCSHFYALSQPHCSLASGFIFRMLHWVGKTDAWIKSHIRSASAVSSHTQPFRLLLGGLSDETQSTRLAKYLKRQMWWASYTAIKKASGKIGLV